MQTAVFSVKPLRIASGVAATLAGLVCLEAPAHAQAIQGCELNQYLNRTAPTADRQLTWDFSIATDPERCLEVSVGQTVVWNGDLNTHPLGAQGGDVPNPIGANVNGSVTFTTPGTFGFVCLNHSSMKGAIKVVPLAPAAPPWALAAMGGALILGGAALVRKRLSQHAAVS